MKVYVRADRTGELDEVTGRNVVVAREKRLESIDRVVNSIVR